MSSVREKMRIGLSLTALLLLVCSVIADDAVCRGYVKVPCPTEASAFTKVVGAPGLPGLHGSMDSNSCIARVAQMQLRVKKTKALVNKILKDANKDLGRSLGCQKRKYKYTIVYDKKNFGDARKHCQLLKGELAHSEAKTSIARKRILLGLGSKPNVQHWFGLTDEVEETDWRWMDGSRVNLAEVGFRLGEPNGVKATNCPVTVNAAAELDDIQCSALRPFVCEIKAC